MQKDKIMYEKWVQHLTGCGFKMCKLDSESLIDMDMFVYNRNGANLFTWPLHVWQLDWLLYNMLIYWPQCVHVCMCVHFNLCGPLSLCVVCALKGVCCHLRNAFCLRGYLLSDGLDGKRLSHACIGPCPPRHGVIFQSPPVFKEIFFCCPIYSQKPVILEFL